MNRFEKYRNHGKRMNTCCACENEGVVRDGLSYAPSDIARLTERGMPVNSLNTGKIFFDGEENPSFHVTSDRCRYVDVADLWEEHMVLRDKARKAALSMKNKS